MKNYKIVFSPTGGTKKVADILSGAFGSDSQEIDLSQADFDGCSLEGDGVAIIAIPSFGGRAPQTAVNRLKMIQGNGVRAVAVAVYGNRAQEDTLIEIADTAKACGFSVIAGIEAVAEHSIIHQYATGRPDQEDTKQLTEFAQQILSRIQTLSDTNANTDLESRIPGNRPYRKAGPGLVPKASSSCVECGICASRCPVGAIPKAHPKLTDKAVCINCMRCVSVCPQKARTVNAAMVKIVKIALKKECSISKKNRLYL